MYYSFATKFMHWCTKEHFPIMDSAARCAISRHEDRIASEFDPRDPDHCLGDYRWWIHFYAGLLRSFGEHAEAIVQADSEKATMPNSLLRILDKYFWMKGLRKR